MPVTSIFKPYVENTGRPQIEGTKDQFVAEFTDILFKLLAIDKGVMALEQISRKTGGLAAGQLLDAIRQSMRIQVQPGNVKGRQQIRISINGMQLRDAMTDTLDNNVVAETRNPNSLLSFVKELLNLRDNICVAFQYSPMTGQIFDVQNFNNKSIWISRHIITAINQTAEQIKRALSEN